MHCWSVRDTKQKKANDIDKKVLENTFGYTRRYWAFDEKFHLMIQNGVQPYEYMDVWEKLEEKNLLRNAFYSKMNMKDISDNDYEHLQQGWGTMEKKSYGYYHDTYLKWDAFLLADVFETLKNTCLDHYELDPGNFYTAL